MGTPEFMMFVKKNFGPILVAAAFLFLLVGIILKTMTTYPRVIEQFQARDSAANEMLFIAAALIILRVVIPIFRRPAA
jgi:hypothetical protein